jgi:hypothetical protein
MTYVTGKHIPRRTFVRGAGAMIGLPFLEAMVPAGPAARAARAALDRPRLIAIEIVHGSAGSNEWGATQNLWSPARVGSGFDLSNPSALSPLEPFRDYLTIFSNTDCRMAEAFDPKEIGGDHFRTSAVFLTQAHPKQTESSDLYVGMSLDQMFARRFGQDTAIPSMQLCIENVDQAGGCGYGYSCAYTDSISWASPVEPLPMIRDPRAAFEQLFGGGGTPEERVTRRRAQRSILDMITAEVAGLKRQLDGQDVQRLDQYMDNVREIERRIQGVETQNAGGEPRELPEAPLGVPDSFGDHMRLMLDLQASAFAADTTRVFTFKLSRDASGRVYPESGTETAFHPASHHGGKSAAVLDFNVINRYHVGFLPYLLDKLKATGEGDANLLDRTMIVYGSAMGDSNLHNHKRCPLIAIGGPGGQVPGGLHLRAPDGTPMANAMLGLLHRLGFDELQSFGDSSGVLASTATVSEM